MSSNFDTRNDTLRKLLGNGITYNIPPFQRDYSWTEEQWEDLWADILDIVDNEKQTEHYMAYLVLQKNDAENFNIIDGQQRLTTLSIIILCILRCITQNSQSKNYTDDRERSKVIRDTYIGFLDAVTLITKSKLTLNRNNDFYYQNYMVSLRELPIRGFKASEHLLRKASDWFEKKITEYIKNNNIPIDDIGQRLTLFTNKMANRLLFTVITVTDELNAYTVFETLNARGVRLSTPDLLKNYLFSIIYNQNPTHDHEMKNLEERWSELSKRLEESTFTDFLRFYWIGHYKSVRKLDLFKDIKKTIRTPQDSFKLIENLENIIELYMSLVKPENSHFNNEFQKYAKILKLFQVKQFYCVVLVAKKVLSEIELAKLLKIFVVISFRYNVISSLPPSELESRYQKIALDITNGKIETLNEITDALKDVYVSDDKFESDFSEASLTKEKIIHYILSEIEAQKGGTKPQDNNYTIEHIMPKNANPDNWKVSDSELDAFVNRLGNLALLEPTKNNKLGNKPYADKKTVFEQSCFQTTQNIAKYYTDWTIDTIERRQHAMAKIAKTIWKIEQFGL